MNTPNPLIPQGTLPESRGKSHVRIAVFTILAIHVVLLCALLMAGCKRDTSTGQTPPDTNTASYPPLPTPDTNPGPVVSGTNPIGLGTTGGVVAPTSNFVAPGPVTPSRPPEPPPAAGNATEHTIVKGDTFSSLAKTYHTTWQAIRDANPGKDSTRLKTGEKLTIPAPTAATSPTSAPTATLKPGETTVVNGETIYAVKSGDNLYNLEKQFKLKLGTLAKFNDLKSTSLKVGQKLKIPAKSATPEPAAPGARSPIQ